MRRFLLPALGVFILQTVLLSFGKNKVNYEDFNWKILRSIHFDIHYPQGMDDLAITVSRMAEEGYVSISNYMNHELNNTIPIIVYPSQVSFQNTNVIDFIIGEGTGGFTEMLKSRIVIPFTGSYTELRHVITHELAHAFQLDILFADTSGKNVSKFSAGRVPLWIIEGISEYLSLGFDETADMAMRDLLFNDKFVGIKDLNRLRVKNVYTLYKEGQSFIFFLEQTYGKEIIGELFRDLRDYRDMDKAFSSLTGKDTNEIEKAWKRFYKRRYYPLVSRKKYEDDEGEQITFHEKTDSTINICPAVSPDGKKIAYLTNRNIYSNLVIITLDKSKRSKRRETQVLIKGNTRARFEGMHLMTNYLSWSRDGKTITFTAQANGRDLIYIVDAIKGEIRSSIELPFTSILNPVLSADGSQIVFTGVAGSSMDLYLYNRHNKKMIRLTDDDFMERYPQFSKDNKGIIYSTNWNSANDQERNDYNIIEQDIRSGRKKVLINGKGNELQTDISQDGKKLIYISNRSGIYNSYLYDLETGKIEKVTDVLSGVFYPRWFPDGKRIAFVSYQNTGYDIFIKDISSSPRYKESDTSGTNLNRRAFTPSYVSPGLYKFRPYRTTITPDWFLLGLAGTLNYGFLGFAQMGLSDYLGNHRIVATMNYVRQDNNNDFNFDCAYYYLRYRWDFGIGGFRQKNPFWVYSIGDINDLIQNVYSSTLYLEHYGGYVVTQYPFSRYLRLSMRASVSRFERNYDIRTNYDLETPRRDVYANLNITSIAITYDNVIWGGMTPLDGFRGTVQFEQSFNLTGHDFTYSSFNFDLRQYFLVVKKFVFAFRGMGGTIFGKNSEYFKYYLGGYNTLRGHNLFAYGGKNMFLLNAEMRFTFVENIKFGFPLFIGIGNIGGVIFIDCGSAWDGKYAFIDSGSGRFADFKMDLGVGLRFYLYPLLILKLDFAWPFDKKSFGKTDIIFSMGFEY